MTQPVGAWAPYVDPGEHILWQGVPSQRWFLLERRDAFLIPFFLIWGGVPGMAVFIDPLVLLLIVPAVFLLVALWMMLGRFLWDGWRRRGTAYLLTDRRVVIACGRPRAQVEQMPLRPGLDVTIEGGSVTFGPHKPSKDRAILAPDRGFTFREIRGAPHVAALARGAIAEMPKDG